MINGMIGSAGGVTSALLRDADEDGSTLVIGDSDTVFHDSAKLNIAIGDGVLDSTTGAALRNTGIGNDTLTALTTGDDNICIGYRAGSAFDAESNNIFIGTSSGAGAIEGANACIAIGTTSIAGAATQDGTVAIGYAALNALTSGAGNLAIGYTALTALISGAGNIAIGFEAADGITTGAKNIAIGYQALGDAGGATVLGSDDNIFIGYQAGGGTWATAVSNKNVGIGNLAMDAAMNGCLNNVGVGYNSLSALNEGDENVAVGYNSAVSLQSGIRNTIIGSQSMQNANGGESYNVAVGYRALNTLDNGHNNTAIGYEADVDVTTQRNQTIIGNSSVFKFLSKEYTCDHASDSGDDARSASSEGSPLKLPAYSIIKSISVIIKTLSNIGTYNVALYLSTDTSSPADDTVLTASGLVEVLGGGASDTCSGNSASAVDIALGSGAVVKQSYYNGFGGAGLPVDSADKYIHVGNAGTGNGDTDPSTAGVLKVLVEYIGLD